MKPILVVSLSLFALTAVGCDKHQVETRERAAARTPTLAVTKVGEATAVAPATTAAEPAAAAPATAAADGMSCGDAEMADGTCAGESGEGAGCAQWDKAAAEVAKRATPTDAVWATIPVKGMSCGGCERRIVANLGKVDGVLGVEADAELGQVRVAFAAGNDAIATDARAQIKALGYKPE